MKIAGLRHCATFFHGKVARPRKKPESYATVRSQGLCIDDQVWGTIPATTKLLVHYKNQRGRVSIQHIRVLARGEKYLLAQCLDDGMTRQLRRSRFISGAIAGDPLLKGQELQDLFDQIHVQPQYGGTWLHDDYAFQTVTSSDAPAFTDLPVLHMKNEVSGNEENITVLGCDRIKFLGQVSSTGEYRIFAYAHDTSPEGLEFFGLGEVLLREAPHLHKGFGYFERIEQLSGYRLDKVRTWDGSLRLTSETPPRKAPRNWKRSAVFLSLPVLIYAAILNFFAHDMIYQFTDLEWVDPRFERSSFVSSDGAMLDLGIHDAGPGSPTILAFVGNVGSRAHFGSLYTPLLEAGATVVAAPYRGAEGVPGERREEIFRADAVAASAAIADALGRDPGPINSIGYSLGTGLALQVAQGNLAGEAMLIAPYARLCEVMTQKSYIPACLLPWVDDWDSLELTLPFQGEVSILHGANDTLIPVAQGRTLANHLARAGHLDQLVILPLVGHNDILSNAIARDHIARWVKALP